MTSQESDSLPAAYHNKPGSFDSNTLYESPYPSGVTFGAPFASIQGNYNQTGLSVATIFCSPPDTSLVNGGLLFTEYADKTRTNSSKFDTCMRCYHSCLSSTLKADFQDSLLRSRYRRRAGSKGL